jgi:two-component system nitrogen regulation sensor histidine kinase NtrY
VHAKRLQKPEVLKQRLERLRKEFDVYSLHYMVGKNPANAVIVQNAAALVEPFQEPALDGGAVDRALAGGRETLFEEKDASKYIRSYAPLTLSPGHPGCLIVARRLNPELADAYATLVDSYQSYEQLKLMKTPLRSSLALTFSLVTGLILFGAIWISFHIARQIVIPIEQIGDATIRVARGDYESRLEPAGDDELGYLVDSFNHMITDLKVSRDEAERRRVYTETILSNLAVGVMIIGPNRQILSGNRSARRILDCESPEGHQIQEIIPEEQFRALEPLLVAAEQDAEGAVSDIELVILSQNRELRVLCTVGRIGTKGGEYEASVLILDDITELMKAQSIMAWREVARRIAHEIKNPLTPLQLSAQRLQRLLADSEHDEVIRDSTLTIVEHVDSIKRLANEFSNFARMPTAEFASTDLNRLVGDLLLGYEDQAMNVTVQFIPETKLPLIMFDREQVRRGILNLIDNAMAALQESETVDPKVVIRTRFDRKRQIATIEIADNGPGVPHGDKTRIFNPYFTTKKGGTGLGLAIVSSVVADHHGRVTVVDNTPRGAKFIIELPISQNTAVTQRLFGGESKSI